MHIEDVPRVGKWPADFRIVVDTVWKRIDGKEVVRVKRVWHWPDQGWTVRAHPVRGGRILVADHDWFLEHYEPWKGKTS